MYAAKLIVAHDRFRAERQKWIDHFNQRTSAVPRMDDAQLGELMAHYQQACDELSRYRIAAGEQAKLGPALLMGELDATLADFREASKICANILAGRRRHQADLHAIAAEANNYVLRSQMESNHRQSATYEAMNRRWDAAQRPSYPAPVCPRCYVSLGQYFEGRHCPHCGNLV